MNRRDTAIFLGLMAVTGLLYLPTLNHGFVDLDDPFYIILNSRVRAGLSWEGVQWAFTTMSESNWHPLTWLSHMIDCQVFGLWAGGHHAVSLLLHAANTGMLYLVLRRLTGVIGRSAMVAALFGLHPLHAESVAWVAERKDVLSTFFWMLTILAYHAYVLRPSRWRYGAVAGLLALGLMAKPMLVTMPCVLLVLDWWPLGRYEGMAKGGVSRRRFGELVLEKIPLFALVVISCVLTYIAQNQMGSVISRERLPIDSRLANAAVAYAAYLWKMVWPAGLAVYYPHPGRTPMAEVIGAVVVLSVISLVAVRLRKWSYLPVGWLWYLGTLVPVIGLVQVGSQAMADRYTYVPLIGIFVALVWGVADAAESAMARLGQPAWKRVALTVPSVAILAACGAMTIRQERYWQDTGTLFRHAIEVTRDNYFAHNVLGTSLVSQGRVAEGIEHFQETLRIMPDHSEARNNLGSALFSQGRYAEAGEQYRAALQIYPGYVDAHYNLGLALVRLGRDDEAAEQYLETLRLKPDHAEAHNNLGGGLFRHGMVTEAMAHFREALRLKPDLADAHYNLGVALAREGQDEDAIEQYLEALRLKPDYSDAQNNLGAALFRQGRALEAIDQFRAILRQHPDDFDAHNNLGIILLQQNRRPEAAGQFREALRLNPDHTGAQINLNAALSP
jgi:tetratricopeptide (TPR) repeat protein